MGNVAKKCVSEDVGNPRLPKQIKRESVSFELPSDGRRESLSSHMFSYRSRRGSILQQDIYDVQLAFLSEDLKANIVAEENDESEDFIVIAGFEYENSHLYEIECSTKHRSWKISRPWHSFVKLRRRLSDERGVDMKMTASKKTRKDTGRRNTSHDAETACDRIMQCRGILKVALDTKNEQGVPIYEALPSSMLTPFMSLSQSPSLNRIVGPRIPRCRPRSHE